MEFNESLARNDMQSSIFDDGEFWWRLKETSAEAGEITRALIGFN